MLVMLSVSLSSVPEDTETLDFYLHPTRARHSDSSLLRWFQSQDAHHHSKVMGLPHGVRLGKGEAGTRHPCPSQQEVSAKVQWDPELSMLLSNNKEILTSWV